MHYIQGKDRDNDVYTFFRFGMKILAMNGILFQSIWKKKAEFLYKKKGNKETDRSIEIIINGLQLASDRYFGMEGVNHLTLPPWTLTKPQQITWICCL